MYRTFVKRGLDLILSGMALLLLSPLFLIVAVLVRIKLGSPVIFHQERPGFYRLGRTSGKGRAISGAIEVWG